MTEVLPENRAPVLELPEKLDSDGQPAQFKPDETEFMNRGSCRLYEPAWWDTDTNHGKTTLRGTVTIHGAVIPKREQIRVAVAICNACPVLADCRAHITKYPEGEGIWAATLPEERAS